MKKKKNLGFDIPDSVPAHTSLAEREYGFGRTDRTHFFLITSFVHMLINSTSDEKPHIEK